MAKAKAEAPSPVAKAFADAQIVLDAAIQRGVWFRVKGESIVAAPSSAVDEELARLIRGRKPELVLLFGLPDVLVNCPFFTVVEGANELAACLPCGGSWELHDKPSRERWKIIKAANVDKIKVCDPILTERIAERAP